MLFKEWADLLDSVELPVDDASLTAALAFRSRFEACVVSALGAFDGDGLWDLDGSTSMTAWLRARGMTGADASWTASTAKRLRSLPVLRAAWLRGVLSSGQVKAVLANVRDRHIDLFASHEGQLVPTLVGLAISETQFAMTEWRLHAEALDDFDPPEMPRHEKHFSQSLDGRWQESGAYAAEGGAVIDAALRVVMEMDSADERQTLLASERRGTAMVDVCRYFLDHQKLTHPGRRNRPHLHVALTEIAVDHVSGQLAEQRIPLDSPTLERLLCDCDLHRIVRDQAGALLDYGKGSQTIPANLWRAIVARDLHCRFEGCDRPATWCEGHHVTWFSRGGTTAIDNLVLMCSRHHHKLHLPGWSAVLKPDGELRVTMPDGRVRTSHPPRVRRQRQRQPAAA